MCHPIRSSIPKLDVNYIEQIDKGVAKIDKLPIYFDDSSTSNIDKIIASIRSMKAKYDISGAVVDYLQILNVNTKSSNKEQAMGDVARRLKNFEGVGYMGHRTIPAKQGFAEPRTESEQVEGFRADRGSCGHRNVRVPTRSLRQVLPRTIRQRINEGYCDDRRCEGKEHRTFKVHLRVRLQDNALQGIERHRNQRTSNTILI